MTPTTAWRKSAAAYTAARMAERGYATPDAISAPSQHTDRPTRRFVPCDTQHGPETRALGLAAYQAWLDIDPDDRRRLVAGRAK